MRRKPAPAAASSLPSEDGHEEDPFASKADPMSPIELDFDAVEHAINEMQQRLSVASKSSSAEPPPLPPRTPKRARSALPVPPVQASTPSPSPAITVEEAPVPAPVLIVPTQITPLSSSRALPQRPDSSVGSAASRRVHNRTPVQLVDPPMLPTINTGEPLRWENGVAHSVSPHDDNPFTDDSAVPYSREYATPAPPAQQGYYQVDEYPFSNDSFSRAHTPYTPQTPYQGDPYSRPTSAYPYESVNTPNYDRGQSLSPGDPRGSMYSLPTHHNSQGEVIADHFDSNADAYASGIYSGSGRRQMRSRSATPMGDDDYYALANNSAEFNPNRSCDMEKNASSYDLGERRLPRFEDEENEKECNEKAPVTDYPDTPVTTQHYGPAPIGRVTRRHKMKKRVQLTRGNLVLDLDVPTRLVLPLRRDEEMAKTRYTAVTCDPDDFKKNNFFLRQNENGRSTELFIVITMYNEDEVLFCRTLMGVMRNISHLCTRKNSQTWGQDAWKKVVVCIVSDGRKKIHPRVIDCLTALGVYQPGDFMKNLVNNKPVTAHLFEYTTSFGLDENLHFRYPDKGIVPTQILFCLKEKNQKKINSHRWFFNAFAPLLRPNVCVLIDVGTRPGHKSLYHLWKTFDRNSNVAGACGEIAAYKGKRWVELINPLVASQNFEYKIANILDKPTESLFGYISVLPGAFSAYRYRALLNDNYGVGPLASYFKGEVLHGRETDIFTSNMYLAEDRILCFELVAKANENWVLRYVKSAVGETDVPDALPEFISQRRRWLNGSFFAAVYAITHANQILQSGHSMGRKAALMAETAYNVVNLIFSWFAIGNFYLFFIIVTSSLQDPSFGIPGIRYFNSVVQYSYASIIVACFLFSMGGNKPRQSLWKYKLSAIFFAIIDVYALICAFICAIQASKQGGTLYSTMIFSIIITYGVYLSSSILALDPWHMLTSFVPYLLLSPTYVNILNIYAFSNLDDISWGTKQDNEIETDLGAVIQNSQSQVDVEILAEPSDVNAMYDETLHNLKTRKPVTKPNTVPSAVEKEQQAKDYYASVRTNVLLAWVLSNGMLLLAILSSGDPSQTFNGGQSVTKVYMTFILAFVGITNIIRFTGSTLYMIMRAFVG